MSTSQQKPDYQMVASAGQGERLSAQGAPQELRPEQITIERSLLESAKLGDQQAIFTMFSQFLPTEERCLFVEYMGVQGMWWVGRYSFACLTERRLASINVGPWGEVVYQDGLLEHTNSGIVYQPGLLGLYVLVGAYSVFALLTSLGLLLVFLPYVVQFYHRTRKCGLLWVIREGVSVYLFTNRNRLTRANHLYRIACNQRERRLQTMGAAVLGTI